MNRDVPVPTLDFFLATVLRESEHMQARLARAGVGQHLLDSEERRYASLGLFDPRTVSRDLLLRVFGEPYVSEPDRLTYRLRLWPDHLFDWRIEEWGGASAIGFRRRVPRALGQLTVSQRLAEAGTFEVWGDTRHEVTRSLGQADEEINWGAAWSWRYRSASSSGSLQIELDLGLVRSVTWNGP